MTPAFLAQTACLWEATARKVGNVHPHAAFADLEYSAFVLSAVAVGRGLSIPGGGVGETVLDIVRGTRSTVGTNTNLGIVLLLAPLAAAADRDDLERLLANTTIRDAECVFEAIRVASPGGLGDAPEQDARSTPTVTLQGAMALAADRDSIAKQYANGFADVFDFGVPALVNAFAEFGCVEAAVVACQLQWLAAVPDSLIARKRGGEVAAGVQTRAKDVLALGGLATPAGRRAGVALDAFLRADGHARNPGTTADLVTACLFVALRRDKLPVAAPFRWPAPDWL